MPCLSGSSACACCEWCCRRGYCDCSSLGLPLWPHRNETSYSLTVLLPTSLPLSIRLVPGDLACLLSPRGLLPPPLRPRQLPLVAALAASRWPPKRLHFRVLAPSGYLRSVALQDRWCELCLQTDYLSGAQSHLFFRV